MEQQGGNISRKSLIDKCMTEITVGGLLPCYLGESEINRIIDEALNFFKWEDGGASQRQMYIIPLNVFKTREFKATRTLILPSDVVGVDHFGEIKGQSMLGAWSTIGLSDNILSAMMLQGKSNSNYDVVLGLANMAKWDVTKALFLDQIAYKFNLSSNSLYVEGRDPKQDVIMKTRNFVGASVLYDDYWFQRYCSAKMRIAWANVLTVMDFSLGSGVKLNVGDIMSQASDELDKVVEKIKGKNVANQITFGH